MNPYPLCPCEHCRDMFQPRTGANKLCSTCVPESDLRARQLYSYYKLCRLCYDAKLNTEEKDGGLFAALKRYGRWLDRWR
jgi:hypothetical protein